MKFLKIHLLINPIFENPVFKKIQLLKSHLTKNHLFEKKRDAQQAQATQAIEARPIRGPSPSNNGPSSTKLNPFFLKKNPTHWFPSYLSDTPMCWSRVFLVNGRRCLWPTSPLPCLWSQTSVCTTRCCFLGL